MDFYAILGVKPGAKLVDVKRAYRRLARRYHPDINPGDQTAAMQFRQITDAYVTLSDPERRRSYDLTGSAPEPGRQASTGFEGFDFSARAAADHEASTFGDLFAEAFQQPGTQPSHGEPQRGADLHAGISLAFDESMTDVERPMTVTRAESCLRCGGTGVLRVSDARCIHCQGAGSTKSARGHMVFSTRCLYCDGTGRQGTLRCDRCGGYGMETRTDSITVRLPAGIADGTRVRVPGKGNAGRGGGPAGDLYVTVQVAPHRLFRREGDDLIIDVPVAVHEAALGSRIDVPTLDGTTRLRVPPGTQSGQRFRLRERGSPSAREGHRGDLVVSVRIVLPPVLDERSRELLREFGRLNRDNVREGLTE
jgi:molecular chaperone DnaJ